MTPLERWCLHLAALLTGGTGLMDGLLRWFGQRAGEFGPEVHPWLGPAQHLHVLVAPVLVFCLGVMVRGHLWPKVRQGREGRRTGLGAALLIAPMVLSGYTIQVVTLPAWRQGMAWVHGISAGAFLLAYFGHLAHRGLGQGALSGGAHRHPAADSSKFEPLAHPICPVPPAGHEDRRQRMTRPPVHDLD
ncbi:MAG: hypothetical protein IPP58_13980 [Holophagaceae bacterium]|uniref:Uncharacterized protein n=1 Tax=Candidatus Geothrix skivensis TaxID=2954439 RepID=A0A9D7SH49_9BACT|nr:hypothetical protein [Candidatus Geothrix skivensis]